MKDIKNLDTSFIRRVIVAILSYKYDTLYLRTVDNLKESKINIPIFYSLNGSNQFFQDYFESSDKCCEELKPIDQNINKIPSGIMKLVDFGISSEDIMASHTYIKYDKTIETTFGRENRDMVSDGRFIPITLGFDIEIKTKSDLDRLKAIEQVMKTYWKTKEFRFRYNGMVLPILVEFPETYEQERNIKFKISDAQERPSFSYKINVLTWMPDIYEETEIPAGENIKEFVTHTIG